MTITLHPTKGNKPNIGNYTVTINGIAYKVHYERIASKIEWSIKTDKINVDHLPNKQAVLDYLETLENDALIPVTAYWQARTPNGFLANLSVETEQVNGSVKAHVKTNARNNDNNMLAINWITREVSEYWLSNFDYKPSSYDIEWGSL